MAKTITVRLTIGEPRVGIWCDTCNLPSGIEVNVYMLGQDGPIVVGTYRQCEECGA